MIPYCKGTARIEGKGSGEVYKIDAAQLDWETVGSDARKMGAEIEHSATVEHPELGTLTWSVWEYPEDVENHKTTDVGEHKVLEDFEYGLTPSPE